MEFYLDAYELIDFKGEKLPVELFEYFADQVERARTVLSKRSNLEIAYILDAVDYMLREGNDEYMSEIMSSEAESIIVTRTKALKAYMDHFSLDDQESLPGARWADYFAGLSMACMAEALYTFQYPEADALPGATGTEDEREKARYAHICDRSIEAMDALCYAEHMAIIEGIKDGLPDSEKLVSMVMGQLGKKERKRSLTPFDKLRNKILKLHDEEYQGISARQAAILLAAEFREEVDSVLVNNDDPEHLIEKWIGKHRRLKRV